MFEVEELAVVYWRVYGQSLGAKDATPIMKNQQEKIVET